MIRNARILVFVSISLGIIAGCDNSSSQSAVNRMSANTRGKAVLQVENSVRNDSDQSRNVLTSQYKYEFSEQHPSNSPRIYVLSLRNLLNKYSENVNDLRETVKLSKLGWIEGYVIDKENNDILLFGRENKNWPDLYMDDLLYITKNVIEQGQSPYCSLDPIPEDVREFERVAANKNENEQLINYYNRVSGKWGDQKVVVGGVPGNSNIARVMLNADYHMKQISQGLDSLPFIKSLLDIYIDRSARRGRDRETRSIMSRFWFRCEENSPVFEYEENIGRIDACNVVILTEAQEATRDGRLYDSGGKNFESDLFADSFSKNFRKAATQVKVYAELENLYRLLALIKLIALEDKHYQGYISLCREMDAAFQYRRTYNIPASYPGLTNFKIIRDTDTGDSNIAEKQYLYLVCGGVEMNFPVTNTRRKRGGSKLSDLRDEILDSRVDNKEGWLVETENTTNRNQDVSAPYMYREITMPQENTLIRK